MLQFSVKSVWNESGEAPHGPILSVGLLLSFYSLKFQYFPAFLINKMLKKGILSLEKI